MAISFFPVEMNSFKASCDQRVQLIVRILGLLVNGFLFAYYSAADPVFNLPFFEHWVVGFSLLFFALTLIGELLRVLDKLICVVFLAAWSLNWVNFVVFWVFQFEDAELVDYLVNLLPLVTILAEFAFNEITFVRIQFIVPVALLLAYLFAVLSVFSTVVYAPYDGIDFESVYSYVAIAVSVLIAWGSLELGKLAREKFHRNSSLKDSLL